MMQPWLDILSIPLYLIRCAVQIVKSVWDCARLIAVSIYAVARYLIGKPVRLSFKYVQQADIKKSEIYVEVKS